MMNLNQNFVERPSDISLLFKNYSPSAPFSQQLENYTGCTFEYRLIIPNIVFIKFSFSKNYAIVIGHCLIILDRTIS